MHFLFAISCLFFNLSHADEITYQPIIRTRLSSSQFCYSENNAPEICLTLSRMGDVQLRNVDRAMPPPGEEDQAYFHGLNIMEQSMVSRFDKFFVRNYASDTEGHFAVEAEFGSEEATRTVIFRGAVSDGSRVTIQSMSYTEDIALMPAMLLYLASHTRTPDFIAGYSQISGQGFAAQLAYLMPGLGRQIVAQNSAAAYIAQGIVELYLQGECSR